MTATLTRWWTPEGEVGVHQLLKPGTDPEKDLGLALLALHKAGAEACNLVAKTAVADEYVLVAALAETRALLAPLAVETISKSVGGVPYAGLLLKDVLDDAEIAALALYRTCLAKSVAPPIAAERVGMVYGVPSRELSRYSSLASDPKSNPRAVADMADRVLFDYVSKLVSEEYVPAKETFSKEVRDWHGQDPGERSAENGQFVRTRPQGGDGLDLEALIRSSEQKHAEEDQRVGSKATDGAAPAKVGQRMQRQQRMKRMTRQTAPQQQGQGQTGTRQAGTRQSGLAQKLTGQELAGQQLVSPFRPVIMAGLERSPGDVLSRIDEGDAYTTKISEAVSFVLPADEYLPLGREAGDVAGRHVLRLGHLQRYAGAARVYDKGGSTTERHEKDVKTVRDLIEQAVEYRGQADFKVGELPTSLITASGDGKPLSVADQQLRLKAAKSQFLKQQGVPEERIATELSHVEHAPLRDDPSRMALVYRPPGRDPQTNAPVTRMPAANVVEVIVKPNQVMGKVEQNGRVHFNANEGIAMATLIGQNLDPSEAVTRRVYWDNQMKAMRTEITVIAVSEETVQKAVDNKKGRSNKRDFFKAASMDDPRTRYYDARGDDGQFIRVGQLQRMFDEAEAREKAEVRVAAPTTPKRMARMSRMSRASRPAAAQQSGTAQQGTKQQGKAQQGLAQMMPMQVLQGQRLNVKPGRGGSDPTDPMPLLDLTHPAAYTVMPPPMMTRLLNETNAKFTFAEDLVTSVELNKQGAETLMSRFPVHGEAAENELQDQALGYWGRARELYGKSRLDYAVDRVIASDEVTEVEDLEGLASVLMQAMERDRSLSTFRLEFRRVPSGRVKVTAYGNHEVLPVLHVLRYTEDAEPTFPQRLVAGGVKRMQNQSSVFNHLAQAYHTYGNDPDTQNHPEIANPYVKTWTVE